MLQQREGSLALRSIRARLEPFEAMDAQDRERLDRVACALLSCGLMSQRSSRRSVLLGLVPLTARQQPHRHRLVVASAHIVWQSIEARNAHHTRKHRSRALLVFAIFAGFEASQEVGNGRVDHHRQLRRRGLCGEILDRAHRELEVATPEQRAHRQGQHLRGKLWLGQQVDERLRILQQVRDPTTFAAAIVCAKAAEQHPAPKAAVDRNCAVDAEQHLRITHLVCARRPWP